MFTNFEDVINLQISLVLAILEQKEIPALKHLVIPAKETFCNHHYFHSKMEAKLCLKQDSQKCSSICFLFLASAKSSSVSSSKKPTLSGPPLCK